MNSGRVDRSGPRKCPEFLYFRPDARRARLVGGAVEWLEGIAPGIGPLLPAILAVGRDKETSASLSVLSGQLAASRF